MRRTIVVLAVLCVNAAVSTAQQPSAKPVTVPAYRARLIGIYDEASGDPIEGVKVSDAMGGMSALTTSTGTVSLIFLPDGGSLVRLQKIGYETQTFAVSISAADTAPLTKTMRRTTPQLPAVVTTADSQPHYRSASLNGFLDRKKLGNGYFIDEAELRKNDSHAVASVLQTKPGVAFVRGRQNASFLMQSPRCTNGGPPQVYLDGVPLAPPPAAEVVKTTTTAFGIKLPTDAAPTTAQAFDLSNFDVSNLAAIEWYPTSEMVPIEFAHTSERCGALLLWTRER